MEEVITDTTTVEQVEKFVEEEKHDNCECEHHELPMYEWDESDAFLEVKFHTLSALNQELGTISNMSLACRNQIFELIQRDSEKIKERLEKLQTFLDSLDKRYDNLFSKIESLTKGDSNV